jgi:SOS-response transcriptional repressor LexA
MKYGLTPRAAECLDAIRRLTVDGVPPNHRQLQVELDLHSMSSITRLLNELRERGHITWRPGVARSLVITGPDADAYTLAALNRLDEESLRMLLAHATGILAHKTSGTACEAVQHRLADRIGLRPAVQA